MIVRNYWLEIPGGRPRFHWTANRLAAQVGWR
jgi:hypothetical protein